jgi:predicted RNA-binding Zn-ribbon protein involved in translation (DUF1610 family)
VCCQLEFTSKGSYLEHHAQAHAHVAGSFSCATCGVVYNTRARLKRHEATHSPDQLYACPECGYASTSSFNVRRHMENRHRIFYQV